MKTTIYCAVSFAIGGISGFLLADHILKEKYEKRVEEEVESVKVCVSNVFRRRGRLGHNRGRSSSYDGC